MFPRALPEDNHDSPHVGDMILPVLYKLLPLLKKKLHLSMKQVCLLIGEVAESSRILIEFEKIGNPGDPAMFEYQSDMIFQLHCQVLKMKEMQAETAEKGDHSNLAGVEEFTTRAEKATTQFKACIERMQERMELPYTPGGAPLKLAVKGTTDDKLWSSELRDSAKLSAIKAVWDKTGGTLFPLELDVAVREMVTVLHKARRFEKTFKLHDDEALLASLGRLEELCRRGQTTLIEGEIIVLVNSNKKKATRKTLVGRKEKDLLEALSSDSAYSTLMGYVSDAMKAMIVRIKALEEP